MNRYNESLKHSDFSKLLDGKDWKNYTWGVVTEVFKIGDYGIVKYISNYDKEDVNKVRFHPFIWTTDESIKYHNDAPYWRDTSTSYYSLESAIVGAIAYKFDGANSQAGGFFDKMIGLK